MEAHKMSLHELHPHQASMLTMLRQSFSQGDTRPVVYAATGWGKTVLAAHIVMSALNRGKRVMFIAPYTALINQTARSFMAQGLPQPGVIQADHPWTNPGKRLQIASIQTLSRRKWPDVDLIINDEAHNMYKAMIDYMDGNETPVIALSGTPFTKGMGKHYSNLLSSISMRELIDQGFLSDYVAYSHDKPDLKGIKTVAGDYHEGQLGERMSDPKLIGCVVDTWLKHGENRPTVCFCVNVAHAEFVGAEFTRVNISNVVITGKTPMEDREVYFNEFKKGNIKILVNVGTLVAGFDSDVRCIIDAAPTKSDIRHVQKLGRGLRTAPGKDHLIILDHAGNLVNLGFPDDLDIDELCDGKKNEAGKVQKKAEVKKEKLPKECPSCHRMKKADEHKCEQCGFIPKFLENVEVEAGELTAIKPNKFDKKEKQRIFSEIMGMKRLDALKGREKSDGYYSHLYKDLVGVWPRNLINKAIEPSEQLLGFVKHKRIAFAKSKEKQQQKMRISQKINTIAKSQGLQL